MSPEQMSWDGDETLYQPRIHSQRIRALHEISEELGAPMTVLVDLALEQFFLRYKSRVHIEWLEAFGGDNQPARERRWMPDAPLDSSR